MAGPIPLPSSPHVKGGPMKDMDSSEIYRGWPPRGTGSSRRPHDFLSQRADEAGLKVVWPPHLASTEDFTEDGLDGLGGHPQQSQRSLQGVNNPQQGDNKGGPNMTMTIPSAFKLRDEAPLDHQTMPLSVPSQPAFKITEPLRKCGDDVWPPRGSVQDETTNEVREFTRPKKSNKGYDNFFLQNSLPSSYPGYRAPPGTQHVGEMDDAVPL